MQRYDYKNLEREWWLEELKLNRLLNNGVFNVEENVPFHRLPRKVVVFVYIITLYCN